MSLKGGAAASWQVLAEIMLLGAIWGGSFLFMRVAAADFGPVALVEMRLMLGALVLLPFLWKAREHFDVRVMLKAMVIGCIGSVLPYVLFAWGAERAPAGIGAMTNAMTVLFAVLVAFVVYDEKIGGLRVVGLAAGFAGVVVLACGKTEGADVWSATMAGTCAALCYGIAVNLVRRHLADIPASAAAAATLAGASVLLAPFALAAWPDHPVAARSWISAILLGVLCTGAATVLYFRLISRVGAAQAASVTYLITLFAVIWAWLVLSEPLTLTMAVSGVLILGGVALSQRAPAAPAR